MTGLGWVAAALVAAAVAGSVWRWLAGYGVDEAARWRSAGDREWRDRW